MTQGAAVTLWRSAPLFVWAVAKGRFSVHFQPLGGGACETAGLGGVMGQPLYLGGWLWLLWAVDNCARGRVHLCFGWVLMAVEAPYMGVGACWGAARPFYSLV